MEPNNFENGLGKDARIEKEMMESESSWFSFKVFVITIGLGFFWLFWGIALSGHRELPLIFRIASYVIFWPSQILVQVGLLDEKFSFFGFIVKVFVNAISYSAIISFVDRMYFICNKKHIFDK